MGLAAEELALVFWVGRKRINAEPLGADAGELTPSLVAAEELALVLWVGREITNPEPLGGLNPHFTGYPSDAPITDYLRGDQEQ